MAKIYSLYSMKRIDVPANHAKNKLPKGTVLKLNGYTDPEYVIIERLGVDTKYGHGATYEVVNLDTFQISRQDTLGMDHIKDKAEHPGIHLFYTEEILPAEQVQDIYNRAKLLEKQKQQRQVEAEAERKKLVDKGKALFAKYIPAEAKALIVANLEQDACDLQSDYFATTVSETVILGFSKHTRDIFSEMRKHAHKIPETSHLAEPPEANENGEKKTDKNKSWWHPSDEHREKYSMGSGYYLKAGSKYSTGWMVQKYGRSSSGEWSDCLCVSMADYCIFEKETNDAD